MTTLHLRRSAPFDPFPLERLLSDPEELALVNPGAKVPFDPMEWDRIWLGEIDDAAFYLVDDTDREVGFFALRAGIGPEQRHLVYVFVEEARRGGAGTRLAELAEEAALDLRALTITLKVELENAPARALYLSRGYEDLGESGGMAIMRKDLVPLG